MPIFVKYDGQIFVQRINPQTARIDPVVTEPYFGPKYPLFWHINSYATIPNTWNQWKSFWDDFKIYLKDQETI